MKTKNNKTDKIAKELKIALNDVIDINQTRIPKQKMLALIGACGIFYPHELENWPELVEQLWYEDYNFREENNFKVI
jgi:S-ribosylhomocysteine lyase LuxS involved in autoinducer biosynthesis